VMEGRSHVHYSNFETFFSPNEPTCVAAHSKTQPA
jgi:hypothetical protein